MQGFLQLIKKEIHRFMSIWIQTLIGPLSTALLYQIIFGHQFSKLPTGILGVSYSQFLIPGLVIMQVLLNAFGNGSSSIIQSKYTGNIIFILMSPITPFWMYFAYLVSSVARGVVVGIVVFLGIMWFGANVPLCWWAVVYFLIFGASITAGLGLIAGIICEKFDQLAGFQSFIMVPLIYLAGVFVNPHVFVGFWQTVTQYNPFMYIVDGFRYGFIQHSGYNIVFGASFVALFAVLINFVGYMLIKQGIKIKH